MHSLYSCPTQLIRQIIKLLRTLPRNGALARRPSLLPYLPLAELHRSEEGAVGPLHPQLPRQRPNMQHSGGQSLG